MRTLPVGAAFGHSANSTINNLKFAFGVSWPWMLVLLPINIVTQIYLMNSSFKPGQVPDMSRLGEIINFFSILLLVGLTSLLVFASIAVSWHRYILLDEVPKGLAKLRLDWAVFRYFGNSILIALCGGLAALVIMFPAMFLIMPVMAASRGMGFIFMGLFYLATILFVIGFTGRLSVKLVSVALGRKDFTLGSAWDATRGNHFRIIGLYILFFVVVVGLSLLIGAATFFLVSSTSIAMLCVGLAVQMVIKWVTTIWGVTLLTSLYGYFVEGREF